MTREELDELTLFAVELSDSTETSGSNRMGALLQRLLVAYSAGLADRDEEVNRLRLALAFAESCIRCGEPWTAEAQAIFDAARGFVMESSGQRASTDTENSTNERE